MSPPDKLPGLASGTYLDEEECLPFPIFMAELELLVGNSKRGKPDGVQLLELLQKLVATIPRTEKAVLKQQQRQCEAMLYDVLAHGIGASVRRLIYTCFSLLYSHGDPISIYTRVNTLQSYLASKEGMSRSTAESIRVGVLDLLAHLSLHYGRMLANAAHESMAIASRTVAKSGNQAAVRCAALRLATAVVRGLNPLDRSAPGVHAEGWTVVHRYGKDRSCEEVRLGCLALLSAICMAGGGPLWRDGAYAAEEALRLCLVLSEDPAQAVRDAAFRALGELAAASRSKVAEEAVAAEKRPGKKASAERVMGGCLRGCLVAPMADAAVHGKRDACLQISGAWMSYISSLPRHRSEHDATADLLEVASALIMAVSEAGRLAAEARGAGVSQDAGDLGAGLAGTELPPLQACAIYVLRRGVMAALAEAAQRKLLGRLASMLDKRLTTPAAVVALEALAALLEAVGEVTEETSDALELLLQPYVTSSSAATRQQAAVTLAALATAHPAAAARMLSGCLDTVTSCAVQMAAPLSVAAAAAAGAATQTAPTGAAPAAEASSLAEAAAVAPSPPHPSRSASSFSVDGSAAAAIAAAAVVSHSFTTSPSRHVTPNGGLPGAGVPPTSSTAAAPGPRPGQVQRAVMDACHGAALASARLLLTTARAPLGCPARLQRRALALAEDLVTGPGPELAGNRAICREVGYLLLGALCSLGLPQSNRGPEDMAALWQVALGEAARRDLDERSLTRPGGELDLAVQLWWRSVALQALSTYVTAVQNAPASVLSLGYTTLAGGGPGPGPGLGSQRSRSASAIASAASGASATSLHGRGSFSGLPPDVSRSSLSKLRSGSGSGSAPSVAAAGMSAAAGAATAAGNGHSAANGGVVPVSEAWGENPAESALGALGPLLQPLMELLDTQLYLLDPWRAKGGPGGILAGAAAMFTLCLLELHLRAPGGRIVTSSAHVALLAKACLRPFRHGLSAAAADALTVAALRPLLSGSDAPLGPWPTGVDPLEDALHTYTGSRGAPHLAPWVTAEEYVSLITSGGLVVSGAIGATPVTVASSLDAGAGIAAAASATDGIPCLTAEGEPLPAGYDTGYDGATQGSAMAAPAAPALANGVPGATDVSSSGGGSSGTGLPHGAFPQPLGLEVALLTAQLVLLGRIVAASPVQQQIQMLDVILAALQTAKTTARQNRDAAACRRPPLAVAAAVVALAAYGTAAMSARRSKAPLDPSDKVPDKVLQLAQALLPDEFGSTAPASSPTAAAAAIAPLSRAAAEIFAASAATGTESWALRVVRALATELTRDGGAAAAAAAANGAGGGPLTLHQQQQRSVVALALGAAHRCRGGLAMQGAVASSAEALVAAASRPGGAAAAAWMLHGLWLVASSGGGAFVPRVRTSLQLAEELLVSSYESSALRAACARLANAAVAVLGPEFTLGSWTYERAKSLVVASGGALAASQAAAAAAAAAASSPSGDGSVARRHAGASGVEGGADGGLGMVLFVQQIILFAPQAVPPAKHVPLLLSRLLSRQPDLRTASALTLRHLTERSADALRPAEAAPLLFAALDGESDGRIAGQLRATLTTILIASGPGAPSFWLELLSDVVFAAGQPGAASATSAGGAADGGRGGGDDDDDKYGTGASAVAGSTSSPGGKGIAGGRRAIRSVRDVLAAPHLRTRHFAAICLLRLVRVCIASDERHRDSAAVEWLGAAGTSAAGRGGQSRSMGSAGGPPGDLLIAKLQVLVDVGFKLATCPLESLRPHGVRLLTLLVQLFGEVPDPLLPGARLMEQYQAQVVSALRSSLGARQAAAGGLPGFGASATAGAALVTVSVGIGSGGQNGPQAGAPAAAAAAAAAMVQHPLLQIAGGTLATVFLESGLAAGDAAVMRRLMELLSAPLAAWTTLRYEPYAEWVGARARVELLRAHAQCAAIAATAASRGDTLCAAIVAKAQEPHAALLRMMWTTLLQDHVILSSQSNGVLAAYGSPLMDGGAATVEAPEVAVAALQAPAAAEGESTAGAVAGEQQADEGAAGNGGGGGLGGFALTPPLAASLRPVYGAACPAVLAALAGALPPPADLTASAVARGQFRRLLEVGLMLLNDAAARLVAALNAVLRAAAGNGADPTAAAAASADAAAAARYTHVSTAATRLANVLRALQRLLCAGYVAAVVPTGPGGGAEEPLVPPAVLRDALSAVGAAAAHALLPLHQALLTGLLPPSLAGLLPALALPCCALMREVCGSAAEATLAGPDPAEGAGAVDETVTASAADTAPGSPARADSVGRKASGWLGSDGSVSSMTFIGGHIHLWDQDMPDGRYDWYGSMCADSTAADAAAPRRSVAGEAAETVLLLASVCIPYAYDRSFADSITNSIASTPHRSSLGRKVGDGSGNSGPNGFESSSNDGGGSMPRWLLPSSIAASSRDEEDASTGTTLPGCVPLPTLSSEHTTGLVSCIVQVLAAAQQLLRRAPWAALEPLLGPLLELPLRLVLTTTPGEPAVTAAQRYLETAIAAVLARVSGPAPSQPKQPPSPTTTSSSSPVKDSGCSGGDGFTGDTVGLPSAYAASAVVALAGVTTLHLQALRRLQQQPAEGSSTGGENGTPSTAGRTPSSSSSVVTPVLLLARFSALVPPLLACAAALDAADPPQPSPAQSPPAQPSGSSPGVGVRGPGQAAAAGSGWGHAAPRTAHFATPGAAGTPHRGAHHRSGSGNSRSPSGSGAAGSHGPSPPAQQPHLQSPQQPKQGEADAVTAAAAVKRPLTLAAGRSCALAVLAAALAEGSPATAALAVLEGARGAVQEAAGEEAGLARGRWARVLLCTLVPVAVERVGALLAGAKQPLAGTDQSVVAECLKLLVLAATLAVPQGAAAQEGVMQVFVPLLIELAAPAAGPAAASPALRDMAIKLITSLPSAAAGAAFKLQLAAQPPAAKLRLQAALRDATTAAATTAPGGTAPPAAAAPNGVAAGPAALLPQVPAGAGAAAAGRRPAIQLKTTFALPLPNK